MTEVFKKLNFKAQTPILVRGAPASFASELSAMKADTEIHTVPKKGVKYPFVLAFGAMRADLEKAGAEVIGLLEGDAVCWFAYPKGTSTMYKSDVNRDTLWELLGKLGIRAVRQIAIDDDWSALRFRREQYVKS
jgi:hypothetical protein